MIFSAAASDGRLQITVCTHGAPQSSNNPGGGRSEAFPAVESAEADGVCRRRAMGKIHERGVGLAQLLAYRYLRFSLEGVTNNFLPDTLLLS
jgi:hypothetical protein